ncbi:MAG: T9SS type A sorting domain-containing protein [Flavobacterium sp.]|nr:T9SS type A sorting domain-containing protein [Flavobacterium sp.]
MKSKLLFCLWALFITCVGFAQTEAYQPPNLTQCSDNVFYLLPQIPIILGNQNPDLFTVTFYNTGSDAEMETSPFPNYNVEINEPVKTVYVRVDNNNDDTYAITQFQLIWNNLVLPDYPDVIACGFYTTPPLEMPGAMYYSGPNGTGVAISPGVAITTTTTLYVYVQSGDCSAEESFTVILNQPPVLNDIYTCGGTYTLPDLPPGYNYYSGPNMNLPIVAPGTVITTVGSHTIYVAGSNGTCSVNGGFNVVIGGDMQLTFNTSAMTLCGDGMVVLTANVLDPNATYQWTYGSVLIPGQTGNTIYVTQPGNYQCSVTDSCGNVASGVIMVQSTLPINQPEAIYDCSNDGTNAFDLDGLTSQIIQGASPANYDILYYQSIEDAYNYTANNIPTTDAFVTNVPYFTIYVRVTDVSTPGGCWLVFPVQLIAQSCTGNTVSGVIRLDADNNGCTDNDLPASNIAVTRYFGNYSHITYTNTAGEYTFFNVEEGFNQIVILNDLPQGYTLVAPPAPGALGIDVTGENTNYSGLNFCIAAPSPMADAIAYFYANTNARPGFPVSYTAYIYNNGTLPFSGNLTVNYDISKLDFLNAVPTITAQDNNTLTFSVPPVAPFSWQYFTLNFMVKQPPLAELGDVLHFDAFMEAIQDDSDPANNVVLFDQTVVNSYDPNEIAVQQGAKILQNQVADYLNYTIHFQNIGNADAVNVKVITELDPKLDWASFRPVGSTHNFTTERLGNALTFSFNNINLPGSVQDEPASNGYVIFKVKPKPTMVVGDIIAADANIYFDFNAAIATNTVTTELVSLLNVNDADFASLEMVPNPASDKVKINFNEDLLSKATIALYDIQGKLVLQHIAQNNEALIDVSKLSPGMYFVKISAEDKTAVKKLIVK